VALTLVERTPGQAPTLKVCDFEAGNLHDVLLKRLVRKHHLETTRCVACLHPSQYLHTLVDRPEVEDHELLDALRWRVGDLIDYPINEALIDSYEVAEGTADRDANQLGVVIVRRSLIDDMYQTLIKAGLKPVAIDIAEFCQRNISELLPESDRGVLVIHLSHTSTQMMGFHNGQLLISRRTGILGDEVHEELENLSKGEADSADSLEALTVEVQRTLNFYGARARRAPPSSLVLLPFATDLPGLSTHLTQMADVPARPLDLNVLLDTREPLDNALQAATVDAVGAALRVEEQPA
jgi:MSHA biogenesis protein MshI